ncbi:MAG TPA: ABC transporter permease [Ktedonobacterales bacterium]|nr:ABC transporter permease [Ktedonobacterales bacterium]
MASYILRRLVFILPVALLVSFIVFMLIHLVPGDPARVLLGEEATPQNVAALRKQLGLDQPLLTQYVLWLGQAVRGNFGQSIQLQQPVLQAILQRAPVTLELGIASLLFSIVIAIPLGVFSATRANSRLDTTVSVTSLLGTAIPGFVLGLGLIVLFAVILRIFPPGGYVPFFEDPAANLRDLILPMITLGTGAVAVNLRQVRNSMIEVLSQDYIRTAWAKGMGKTRVYYLHALRNALLPLLTIVGLQAGAILGGAVIIETIFQWPGLGALAVSSLLSKDYPVIQATVLLSALSYMLVNLLVDVGYGLLDPRISYGKGR